MSQKRKAKESVPPNKWEGRTGEKGSGEGRGTQ